MNLLVVTQYFWPEKFLINELVKDLQAKGHEITVYTGTPNYPEGKVFNGYCKFCWSTENFDGIKVLRVPLITRGKGGSVRLALNYFSFVLFSCVSVPFLVRENYDAIFVFEPSPISVCLPAILIKKSRKIPIVLWVQDLWPESLSATGAIKSNFIIEMVRKLVKYIYQNCNLILVQSRAFTPSIKDKGISGAKISYFPNSAEKLYKPIEKKCVEKIDKEIPAGFRVVFAGNIGAAQSIDTIVDAALLLKEYTDIQWVIIGDGRKKEWLENQVQKNRLDNTVYLLGQKPISEMPYYFSAADILLVTLKRDPIFSLTIPSKIQSYLACGKPIVASIDGESARIIEESRAGVSVPAENAEELSHAVIKMYELQKSELDEMGKNGRRYFEENFESNKLISQLENLLQALI